MPVLEATRTVAPSYRCARCLMTAEEVMATEPPRELREIESMSLVIDHTLRPKVKTTRKESSFVRDCAHVWITEEEFNDGNAQNAIDRADLAAAVAEKRRENEAKKLDAHRSHDFRIAARQCMERSWLGCRVDEVWDIKNPPRYMGLKVLADGQVKGFKKGDKIPANTWMHRFPNHWDYTELVDEFVQIITRALGEFHAMAKHEFVAKTQQPHTQFLFSYPFNEDGSEKIIQFPKGSKYARFNKMNLTFQYFVEVLWGELSGQRYDISSPRCTWVAMTEKEIRPLETLQDHVERFIDYSRKDTSKYAVAGIGKDAKNLQNEFAVAWYGSNRKFQWWRIYGFTNLRKPETDPISLEARTASAQAYLLYWARKHSGTEVKTIEVDVCNEWGIPTGQKTTKIVGMFAPGATQGGQSKNKIDPEDFTKLRQRLAYYNTTNAVFVDRHAEEEVIADITVQAEEVIEDPFAGEEVHYAEPFRFSARYLKELRKQPAPWWDRPGADECIAAILAEPVDSF